MFKIVLRVCFSHKNGVKTMQGSALNFPWTSPYSTRNSSRDEIANVNFFTTTSSTTFTQCALEATEFGEITQNNDHYAVQGHSG